MANRFICGFDDYGDATGLAREWVVAGSPTIVAGRTGDCVSLTTLNNITSLPIIPEGKSKVTIGFAVATKAASWLMEIGESANPHIAVARTADGHIQVLRHGASGIWWNTAASVLLGTSTSVVPDDVWTYLELQLVIHDTAGEVHLRFNGAEADDLTLTGIDTRNLQNGVITQFGFKAVMLIDDLYVNDDQGTVCNGFVGNVRANSHFPASEGAQAGWTPSTGVSRALTIDEVTPSVADYNSTLTLNAIDTFHVESFKNGTATILAIQNTLLVGKSDPASCAIASMLNSTPGTTQYPKTTPTVIRENYSLAEGDAKRAAAGFNAGEWGYKKVA